MRWPCIVPLVLVIACGDNAHHGIDAGMSMLVATDQNNQPVTVLDLGAASPEQTINATLHVTNVGTAESDALATEITGFAATDFTLDNQLTTCAARILAPNQSCTIALVFHSIRTGSYDATVEIVGGPGEMVTIAVRALVVNLVISPTSVDFGAVETMTSSNQILSLINIGGTSAPIDTITTSGNFSIAATTCTTMLGSGQRCDVVVTFMPAALSAYSGALTANSGIDALAASLQGHGGRRITVIDDGTGSGTVWSDPAGLDCGATCSAVFDADVTLTAVADATSTFTGWSDPTCGSSPSCVVPVGLAPVTLHATFTLN